MNLNGDFREFLSLLIEHQVKFLLVGAQALAVHGKPRFTGDLDVWVDRDPSNAERLVRALATFGFENIPAQPFTEHDRLLTLGREPVRIDIFTHIPGPDFAAAWSRRESVKLGAGEVPVIGREDFILSKQASGRAKDLADLALLNGE